MAKNQLKGIVSGKGAIEVVQSTFSLWETDEELAATLPPGDTSHLTEIVLQKKASKDR